MYILFFLENDLDFLIVQSSDYYNVVLKLVIDKF